MDERSDAAEPPAGTLAHDRAQTRPPHEPSLPPQTGGPRQARGAPGHRGAGSGTHREAPVNAPPALTGALDGAPLAAPAPPAP
ncbi:hypothetical protein ACWCSW_35615, partial [Streptomyces sp. NPDC001675]